MDPSSISARPDVTVATTQARVTPIPNRGAFKQVLAQSLVRGAETAMKVLPGGPLIAVAVRGAGGSGASLGIPLAGIGAPAVRAGGPEGPGGARGGGVAGGALTATGAPQAGGTGAPGDGSIESSLQQSQEMNLYYLKIQEDVNAQNRSFTTLSNLLKAEHDTVKTAIGNIR